MLQLPLSVYLFNVSKKDLRQASMDILLMSLLLNRCFPTGLLVIHNWAFFLIVYLLFKFLNLALYMEQWPSG